MRFYPRALAYAAISCLVLALAGCGGSGPVKKQINPPRASVQQLTVLANGQWKLLLRLQNFSNAATEFNTVSGNLSFGGQDAGGFSVSPHIGIGPESADTVETIMTPSVAAKLAVASALSSSQSIRYGIKGRIATTQRKNPEEFEYESALNPAPGLPGVLR